MILIETDFDRMQQLRQSSESGVNSIDETLTLILETIVERPTEAKNVLFSFLLILWLELWTGLRKLVDSSPGCPYNLRGLDNNPWASWTLSASSSSGWNNYLTFSFFNQSLILVIYKYEIRRLLLFIYLFKQLNKSKYPYKKSQIPLQNKGKLACHWIRSYSLLSSVLKDNDIVNASQIQNLLSFFLGFSSNQKPKYNTQTRWGRIYIIIWQCTVDL